MSKNSYTGEETAIMWIGIDKHLWKLKDVLPHYESMTNEEIENEVGYGFIMRKDSK